MGKSDNATIKKGSFVAMILGVLIIFFFCFISMDKSPEKKLIMEITEFPLEGEYQSGDTLYFGNSFYKRDGAFLYRKNSNTSWEGLSTETVLSILEKRTEARLEKALASE